MRLPLKQSLHFLLIIANFSGGETVEEIEVLRRYSVTTLDWKRKTSPKVLMRYENPKTQSKSGKDLKLTNYSTLLHECECLSGVKKRGGRSEELSESICSDKLG